MNIGNYLLRIGKDFFIDPLQDKSFLSSLNQIGVIDITPTQLPNGQYFQRGAENGGNPQ